MTGPAGAAGPTGTAGTTGVTGPAYITSVTAVATGAASAGVGQLVLVDTTGGAFTVTLPTAAGAIGRPIVVKNISLSTNAINVATTGGQTIDGQAAPQAFSGARRAWTFTSDGSNWYITSSYTV